MVAKVRSGKKTQTLYLLRNAVAAFPFLGAMEAVSASLVQGCEGGTSGLFSSYHAETCC